jgi:hypothetical protein
MFKRVLIKAFVAIAVLCCWGCGEAKPTHFGEDAVPLRKKLDSYPQAERMLLGEFQAQVKPLQSIPVSAPVDGDVRFHIETTRAYLKKDTLWAEVAPEQIAGEEREVELTTMSERLRIEQELQGVERELERVEYMLADPALRDIPYGDRIAVTTNLLEQLHNEKVVLEEQLAASGLMERLAFEQNALRSRLTMPFDGELLVYLPVKPERKVIRVAANTPVGVMRDVSEILLYIIIRDPHIAGIPSDQLSIHFTRDSGKAFTASFRDTQITEAGEQDILIYRFNFKPEDVPQLVDLIGASLTCELWVDAAGPIRIVPKVELARMLGDTKSAAGWPEAVKRIWPQASIVYYGRSELGIRE